MDNRHFAIGVLSVTAVVLLVGLFTVHSTTSRALASAGPGIESGDYVLATGQFLPDEHLLYVIDSVAQRLVVYRFDVRSRQSFSPTDGHDLAALREQTTPATPKRPPARRGRGRRYP